jgi:two-component system NarL family sensor kinase
MSTNTDVLKRHNRELSILNTIAATLNREVNLTQALHSALDQVVQLLDLQTGWVWLLDEDGSGHYLAAAQNLPPALGHHPRRMEGDCYCLDSYKEGNLENAANISVITCTRLKNLADGTEGLRYHASIPLNAHGKKMGILNVVSSNWQELSEDTLKLLYTIGDLIGIAIERAQLFAQSIELGALEERNRLAREIHDTLAQGLTAITLQLETADALLDTQVEGERIQQIIQNTLNLARQNLEETRRSVLDLRAAPLEGRTLAEALEALARDAAQEGNLQYRFEASGASHPLPVRIESGLYRIGQESITNIVKHAQATRFWVKLAISPETVKLVIGDNGIGCQADLEETGGYGLIGINERAKLLGGSMEIQSDNEAGTHINVHIPLDKQP